MQYRISPNAILSRKRTCTIVPGSMGEGTRSFNPLLERFTTLPSTRSLEETAGWRILADAGSSIGARGSTLRSAPSGVGSSSSRLTQPSQTGGQRRRVNLGPRLGRDKHNTDYGIAQLEQ